MHVMPVLSHLKRLMSKPAGLMVTPATTSHDMSLICMYVLILSFWFITAVSLDSVYKKT
jgi:hypothetical protein